MGKEIITSTSTAQLPTPTACLDINRKRFHVWWCWSWRLWNIVKHQLSFMSRAQYLCCGWRVFYTIALTFTWLCCCVGFVKFQCRNNNKWKKNFVNFQSQKLGFVAGDDTAFGGEMKALCVCLCDISSWRAVEPIALTFSIETQAWCLDRTDVEETRGLVAPSRARCWV